MKCGFQMIIGIIVKYPVNITDGEIFREGTFKEDVVLDLNKEIGRYVRIIAKGAGECPATHVRPGQEARIYFDEVMIE